MTYLLDTNVLSEWRKAEPDAGVADWFARVHVDDLYISVVTIGEIRRGISRLQHRSAHRQAAQYESWLAATKDKFADRVIPIDADIAEEWGHDSSRHLTPMADALIAATARVRGWTVVTRNVKDFEPTGVRLLNPFAHPRPA
ncbi:VapC toxin protein [Alloactinosynnema sp. L-07]|uniref:type II toxin-antitoxin system VapC family toxin n=1 Tax=Alloactinosynnema sp. L-07 TaxID=1653480 RepID=UPI00065F0356|nr:type II toxin-antitoxin system VapC family toxin [Alloactinosynnema sp. L-07]CRK54975.1 VapC toxin protein [Alloactinosynnema sp. L-07]